MYANAALFISFSTLFLSSSTVLAAPVVRRAPGTYGKREADAATLAQNAAQAQAQNAQFASLTASSSCTEGSDACVNGAFAQCVGGKLQVGSACAGGTTCVALPLVNKAGTSVTCDTQADAIARIQAAGGSASLTGSGGAASSSSSSSSGQGAASNSGNTGAGSAAQGSGAPAASAQGSTAQSGTSSSSSSSGSDSGASSSSNFKLANAQAAQALNAKFATLTADSACTEGEDACVNGAFAQCVGGKLQVGSACAGGTTCVALPLVNKPGTSVTCDTQADAIARMQAAGASASLTGDASASSSNSGSGAASSSTDDGEDDGEDCDEADGEGEASAAGKVSSSASASSAAQTAASGSSSSNFKLANAQQAQALNAKFATLAAGSACTEGEDACVNGAFAQCVGGKFQVGSACAGGTTCVALPLVNKPGTSVTCDTQADAVARMQAAGASASLTGQ